MGKIFYIMGKSASGKDSLYHALAADADLGLRHVVMYTTRPMREGETEGVEYHFTDTAGFEKCRADGHVIESRTYHTVFGDWHYFTADDGQIDLDAGSYIMIGTPEAYVNMLKYFGDGVMAPVYIEVPAGKRLIRAVEREMRSDDPDESRFAELCRRYLADEEDFAEDKLAQAGIAKRFANDDFDECLAQIKTYIQTLM